MTTADKLLFFILFIFFADKCYGNPLKYEINEDEIRITDCNISYEGSLIIPSNIGGKPVTSIGIEAFLFCKRITSIYIPESIVKIEHAAFSYCDNLIKFEVDRLNQYFSSENGVLFDKSKSTIIQYPAGKSGICTIPKTVVDISDRAFLLCWKLNKIIAKSLGGAQPLCAWIGCDVLTQTVDNDYV